MKPDYNPRSEVVFIAVVVVVTAVLVLVLGYFANLPDYHNHPAF
jgi:hypothetical protein